MAITQTNVVSGLINVVNTPTVTVGSGITAVASGLNVNVGNFPSTSISGNVVNISGQPVQTSVSGNVLQASISGDILVTSFSGNVITTLIQSPVQQSINWVYIKTGFILPGNTSGGIDLPDIGTFNSGLPIAVLGFSGHMIAISPVYGTSGYVYLSGAGALPTGGLGIGRIPGIDWNATIQDQQHLTTTLFPFTKTSQIKVCVDPTESGLTLVYGGFI